MDSSGSFFELSPYHVLMAAIGAAIFVAHWFPRLAFPRAASSAALLMIVGLVTYTIVPGMEALDPTTSPRLWEMISEIVLIVVLFALPALTLSAKASSRSSIVSSPGGRCSPARTSSRCSWGA